MINNNLMEEAIKKCIPRKHKLKLELGPLNATYEKTGCK